MDYLIQKLTIFFDYLLRPFSTFPPSVGLCIISAGTGIVMLKLFGIFSDQRKIKKAKDQIKIYLLGIVLYKDDIRISLKMQTSLFAASFRYLRCSLWPLIILVILCIPILGQLNARYGYRPFMVGEKIKVFVHVGEGVNLNDVALKTDNGIKVLTPALQINDINEVDWKLQATKSGLHEIEIYTMRKTYTKEIMVGDNSYGQKLSPFRLKNFVKLIFYPGENLLPQKAKITSIYVSYPEGHIRMFGYDLNWLVIFCIVSILSGLALKRFLRVEI